MSLRSCISLLAFMSFFSTANPAFSAYESEIAQDMVHVLDYLAVDYPAVVKDGRIVDSA